MDAEPSPAEEDVPGTLNITDEMKRMLNQLWVTGTHTGVTNVDFVSCLVSYGFV